MDLEKLQPWQGTALDKIKKAMDQGLIQTTNRQSGKSVISAYMRLWNDIHQLGPVEELLLSQGTVYGARYYTVEPIGGNWMEMELWCGETFGPGSTKIWQHDISKAPAPELRWYMNNRKFWFQDEADRTMFILKWS